MTASPLRVEDALSYLDNVKNQFSDQPRNRDLNYGPAEILYLFEMRLPL